MIEPRINADERGFKKMISLRLCACAGNQFRLLLKSFEEDKIFSRKGAKTQS